MVLRSVGGWCQVLLLRLPKGPPSFLISPVINTTN